MKKIYSIFSFLLIFNIHIYLKNVECNDIINYNGLNLRNGLPHNSLDLTNGLNNRNESIIDSKIEVHENNFYQNKDNTISVVGQDVPNSSEASSKIINANDSEGNNIDNTRGLSVTDSGIPDGGAFGGGLSVSENSPLQGGLNKCPIDKFCNGINTIPKCLTRTYEERNNTWTFIDVKTENAGLIVPPRRRKLCFGDISKRTYRIRPDDKLKNLKDELTKAAFTETASIFKKHEKDPENIFSAMKYSFADIADIVKGNDMIDDIISKNISNNLDKIFKDNDQTNTKEKREKWWKENKNDIWNSMMCTYMKEKKDNKCPNHDNIHEVPQMFRWFREWGSHVCKDIKKNREDLKVGCKNNVNVTPNSLCNSVFKYYQNIINAKRSEWEIFVKHFDGNKNGYSLGSASTPNKYLNDKCPECDCSGLNLEDIFSEKEYDIQSILKELSESPSSESVSTNISPVVQPTGQENTEQTSVSTTREQQSQEQPQSQPQNIQRANNNDNILGWEFGPVAVPGKNPYISSEEKNSLELINLTSWDKEDIIKQNEDVKEEFEEEQAQEELEQEEIEEEQDELLEELQQEEIEEEQDELQEELQEEQDEEEDKSNKEGEQEKKTEDEKKEETIDSSDDKNAHESLSIGYKNNNETKKDAEAIIKDLFSLFKEKNTFEDLLKDLTGDLASLFQKQ